MNSSCKGFGKGKKDKYLEHEIFKAVKLFCMILQWWIHDMYLVKSTELYNTVNPNINYELWGIMMYQWRFIDYNKCTSLVEDVDNLGWGCTELKTEVYRKALYFPIHICSKWALQMQWSNNQSKKWVKPHPWNINSNSPCCGMSIWQKSIVIEDLNKTNTNLSNLGIDKNFLNLIKYIYKNPHNWHHTLQWKRTFLPKMGRKTGPNHWI